MTLGWRRLGRMLMLDRMGIAVGLMLVMALLFLLLPVMWALIGSGIAALGAVGANVWLGKHLVLSQLPMRAIPQRLRKLVDAPVFVFGHTHDIVDGELKGTLFNPGTWIAHLDTKSPAVKQKRESLRELVEDGRLFTTELRAVHVAFDGEEAKVELETVGI